MNLPAKQLSKKSHPDRQGGDRATFEKVTEAYSILGDDAKRYVPSLLRVWVQP
jgi:DnaJ-class molecular chaperone